MRGKKHARKRRDQRRPPEILITGSHGFLGSAFARLLDERKIPYSRYKRGSSEIDDAVNVIVHFGGINPVSAGKNATAEDYAAANVEATERLLTLAARHKGLLRFINIGSASEYGAPSGLVTEGAPERPSTDYARSKLAQTRAVERFARETGIPTINLRVFNVAGLRSRREPGSSSNSPTVFDSVIEQLEAGERVVVTNRHIVRDFIDIDDISEAVLKAATAKQVRGYELINIATGTGTSLGEIAKITASLLGRKPKLADKQKKWDSSIGDASKAARLLDWKPRVPIDESIRRMIGTRTRVLIVGAGIAGRSITKELEKAGRSGVVVVGLVDDDRRKQGRKISGAEVVGTIPDLPRLIRERAITQILLSAPSADKSLVARVSELVPPGFPIKVLPSATSVLLRNVALSDVRDIDPSDLVGRPLVKADQKQIARATRGKTFLVTGGAGSIGSEIVRQLYSMNARSIVALDAWEEGIFNLLSELAPLQSQHGRPKLIAKLGNVRDRAVVDQLFRQHEFDVVIHAAAYKHVPLLEDNPDEAQKTNIAGTRNVLDAAVKHGTRDFVLISTDKAVRPANVMGRTKRAAELLVRSYGKKNHGRRFMAVRFGNVLNSSGSVIPTFLRQIRARMPLTLTDPEMTRYFMSIPEAVSLVLLAWIVGKSRQVMVLDMGKPERILDLALRLIRIHGLEPYKDIPINVIGIRPGEKLHEELAYDGELKRSSVDRIFIAEDW